MITADQKYVFTLTFDFINILKVIQDLDEFFDIDKEKDYTTQILEYANSIFLQLGQNYNEYIHTSRDTNVTEIANSEIIHKEFTKVLDTEELQIYIKIGSNYSGIRLDNCYVPNHCYTLLIVTEYLQTIHQLIDIFAINGDSINYTLKSHIVYKTPNDNKEE